MQSLECSFPAATHTSSLLVLRWPIRILRPTGDHTFCFNSIFILHALHRDRNQERLEGLLAWQGQVYRRQVYGFNCLLMSVLVVVLILVSAVPSFNYRDNILSSFWFSVTSSLLLLSGLLSLLLTHQLDKPCLPEKPDVKDGRCDNTGSREEGKKTAEEVSKRGLCLGTASCLSCSLLVLLPGIIGLVVLGSVQQQNPYLLLVHNNAGSELETVSLSVLSGLSIHNPSSGDLSTTSGPASTDCSFLGAGSGRLWGAILLVNSTRPACRALLASGELVNRASKVPYL